MPSDSTSGVHWLVWTVGGLLLYVVVSNTLYLLLGARLLQFLPGVNLKGFRGTLRLALLLAVSVVASICWVPRRVFEFLGRREPTRWKDQVAQGIRVVARIVNL